MKFGRARSHMAGVVLAAVIGATVPLVVSSGPSAADTTSSIVLPASGATVSGTSVVLDALEPSTVTAVEFYLIGAGTSNQFKDLGAAASSPYGWYLKWDSTSVPDENYYQYYLIAAPVGGGTAVVSVFFVNNSPTPASANLVLPSGGASVSGTSDLDATVNPGSNGVGATGVYFFLNGGPCTALPGCQIGTGTPTLYGWLGTWNSQNFPNGTYSVFAVAVYNGNNILASTGAVTITVNNPPPTTTVVLPSNNASAAGSQYLDATASAGVTSVTYELSGGPANLNDDVIATGTPTLYGWLATWNTTGVADGTYTLQSVASYGGGVSGPSLPVTVTVAN